jgi:hypothetical protein
MGLSPDKEKRQRQLDNIKNHKFPKGVSGNPGGLSKKVRERNRINKFVKKIIGRSKVIQDQNMTKNEIDSIEQKMLAVSLSEAQLLAKADNSPLYMKSLAMAIIIDMKNGKTDTVDKLRERQYGKTVQRLEVTGKDGQPINMQNTMTQTEAKDFIKKLEDEY